MTQIVTDGVEIVDSRSETEVPTVGVAPVVTAAIDEILDYDLVEDVSIDGMCGVY